VSTSLIQLKNVTMKFGGVTALSDVTFDVKNQEILGLIGPNGAGKTTVFNVITGVYQITSGEIIFDGNSLSGVKRYKITKRGVARTFQNIRLWGDMTALENVMTATDTHKKSGLVSGLFGLPISRREEKRDKARAQELLDFIGIGEYALQKTCLMACREDLRLQEQWEQSQNCFSLMSQRQVLTLQRSLS